MKLSALEIADAPAERIAWLERQIISPDLADLVAQWSLFGADAVGSLDSALGDALPAVVEQGLTAAHEDQVAALLDSPTLLLDLQTRVLLEGGEHWQELLEENASSDAYREQPAEPMVTPASLDRSKARMWPLAMALAASIAFVAYLQQPAAQTPQGWGFNEPGLFASNTEPDEYFETLAEAAEVWFNKRPETEGALTTRLTDFRDGCDALLAASHDSLNAEQKAWLLQRCRLWRSSLNNQLHKLSQEGTPVVEVRKQADALVRRMAIALREKATA